jgi:thymidylate synthase (FAD)
MILVKPSYEILTAVDGLEVLGSIERKGRVCYKSEDRITDDSAEKFVRMIVKSGHESVLEHESISVKFVVDRGVSHELVRHRLASYSQESTRYCNYGGGVTFVIPSWVKIDPGDYGEEYHLNQIDEVDEQWFCHMQESESSYVWMLGKGWTPQQARSVLPNSLKTEIVCTTNIREWRHILKLRTSSKAHPQMVEVMCPLLDELKEKLPVLFEDIL